MTPATATHLIAFLPIVFISAILPWYGYSRRGILFGVTVPLHFNQSPQARAELRRFRLGIWTTILTVLGATALIFQLAPPDSLTSLLATTLSVPLELIAAYLLWRRSNAAIKPYAITVPLERRAELSPVSVTGPLTLTALSIFPIDATALYLRLHWNQIPLRWPQHWNAAGAVNDWGTRTTADVFGPLLTGVIVILMLFALGLFISRASGPQAIQRRRSLIPLAALSWIVAGAICMISSLPLTHLSSTAHLIGITIYLGLIFAVAFWMMYRSGLAPGSRTADPYDSTPDARWYGGLIYYNPTDAAILVPKRFGWGWTFNFARPASWICIGAILLFGAAATFLPVLLK